MKKLICILSSGIMLFASCAATSTSGLSKAEKRQQRAEAIHKSLEKRRFKVDISTMNPQGYPSRVLTSPYSLEIKGDSLISYLPYMGRAYSVPYGGGKGLNFVSVINYYNTQMIKDNLTRIEIKTENDEDGFIFTIEVFDNGNATINVNSRNRNTISYNGKLE